jgi:hypothetical protein
VPWSRRFTRANAISAVDFARQLSNVTSPLEFMKLSNACGRQQFAALTTQTKAPAGIARKLTQETAEPAKAKDIAEILTPPSETSLGMPSR